MRSFVTAAVIIALVLTGQQLVVKAGEAHDLTAPAAAAGPAR